jgi:hypothetical protein
VAVNELDHFSHEKAQLRWNETVSMLNRYVQLPRLPASNKCLTRGRDRDRPVAAGETTVVPISALGDINIGPTSPSSFGTHHQQVQRSLGRHMNQLVCCE